MYECLLTFSLYYRNHKGSKIFVCAFYCSLGILTVLSVIQLLKIQHSSYNLVKGRRRLQKPTNLGSRFEDFGVLYMLTDYPDSFHAKLSLYPVGVYSPHFTCAILLTT